MARLIDTHCHLTYDYSPKTEADLVREAGENGICALVTIGVEMESLPSVAAVSERYPHVYHTVGVHPHEAEKMTDTDIGRLEAAAAHPKCRAIGEIGLDYYYTHSSREIQRKRLGEQLDLARKLKLPVVIHGRDAEQDLLEDLRRYAKSLEAGSLPGIIHCFTSSLEFGSACLDLGFYISFSGILTFKNAEPLREAARVFPIERLLVETDSPYLAPVPYRGKKCEPSMVRATAMKLAEIKGLPLEKVAEITTANAARVFGITVSG